MRKPASVRSPRSVMIGKLEIFKALLAGKRTQQVSDEYNITVEYVRELHREIILRLAIQAERSIDIPFPHKGQIYEINGNNPKGPLKRIRVESLTIPRVRKQKDYWLKMIDDARLIERV